jgi:hypothetical protein
LVFRAVVSQGRQGFGVVQVVRVSAGVDRVEPPILYDPDLDQSFESSLDRLRAVCQVDE